ncbi:MAG TPA: Gfo/Idh/MocA family oxidoreductase [Kiritimatiellia bacterium]|nr:Gfo/Idh/MocA family oxidoreductase [Kiritimatiellia bacterium]
MGMIGGGQGAFIGSVHRMAATLDGSIELVCGAFSSDPQRSRDSGHDWFIPPHRCYPDMHAMISGEAQLPPEQRMDFVTIVTPNHLHYPAARLALEAGFDVVCDKPLTSTLADAQALVRLVEETGRLFMLTHNYTGYPMIREARARIRSGALGALRGILVEYPQGWLATALEQQGQKQAAWRTDPAQAGLCGCMGDIGTHAENLAEFVTGLPIQSLCADLATFIPGRRLDDYGSVLLHFHGGARGVLTASQVFPGEENALRLRVYGVSGGLDWSQQEPNTLTLLHPDRPREILRAGGSGLHESTRQSLRLPAGHPEGFIEAFANLYRDYASAWWARHAGLPPPPSAADLPTAHHGLRGIAFLQAVVESSQTRQWINLPV